MELKDYIILELDNQKQGLTRVLDSLNQEEISWRPGCGCNSIGIILLHMVRFEDASLQARIQGKPELWESEKWYQKFNLPLDERGAHFTVEQVNAFVVPEFKKFMTYADAVRFKTLDYVKKLTPDQMEKRVNMPRTGETPLTAVFARIVAHLVQHNGEISYIRGIQRGMDK